MDTVREIMIKDAVYCTPISNLEDSINLMKKYECTKIPVVNTLKDRVIIGAVSMSDLYHHEGKIIQYMSKNLRAVYEDSTVDECLKIMILNNVEQVPVVDKQGHFCGIVTQKEILKH